MRLSDASKTPSSWPIWASAAISSRLTEFSFSPRARIFVRPCESHTSGSVIQIRTGRTRLTSGARPRQ